MADGKETKLRRVLRELNMEQKELHRRTGLALSTINEIAVGRLKFYSTATLFKICKATGKTPSEILDYEEHTK